MGPVAKRSLAAVNLVMPAPTAADEDVGTADQDLQVRDRNGVHILAAVFA